MQLSHGMSTVLSSFLEELQQVNVTAAGNSSPSIDISLSQFFRDSWDFLEPSTELVWNWHLEAICEHVEAMLRDWLRSRDDKEYKQRMQNLLIHVPPGSSKSRIASVCTTPWMWLIEPSWRGMYLSGTPGVASRDALLARDLIESEWYQETFKPAWRIRVDKRAVENFWNDAGGRRTSGGVDSRITGQRSDAIFCDDLDDAQEVFSEPKRLHVHERWDNAIENRVSTPSRPVRIGICQKLHEDDWAGHVFNTGKWDRLRIRQCFVPGDKPTAIGWIDPRTEPGELMDPIRFDVEFVESEKAKGSYYFAAQHQQEPAPMAGGMFKRESWGLYADLPETHRIIMSVDTPFKKGPTNDYCEILIIGEIWPEALTEIPPAPKGIKWKDHLKNLEAKRALSVKRYLIDEWHGKAGIIEAESAVKEMSLKHPSAIVKIIEEKANGSALSDRLEAVLIGIERFNPGSDSKEARALIIQPYLENGLIFLPADRECSLLIKELKREITVHEWWDITPPQIRSNDRFVPIVQMWKSIQEVGQTQQIDGIVDEFAKFPAAKHDDRVDALSQAIIWSSNNPYSPSSRTKTAVAPPRPIREKITSLD